jgi:tetratricopeptide (TPR) repeat protein
VDKGQFAEAATAFERAAQLDPASPKAWRNLGNARAALGDDTRAFAALSQAAALAGADAESHYDLGVFLLERDRHAEAVTAFTNAAGAPRLPRGSNTSASPTARSAISVAPSQFKPRCVCGRLRDAARNLAMARGASVGPARTLHRKRHLLHSALDAEPSQA